MFADFSLYTNFLIFVGLAVLIWIAGTKLSHLADAIAEQTKIARATMGLIVLAAITELPEIVTTMTASAAGNAALALNNMFGGITMQTAVLALADAAVMHAALTTLPRKATPVVVEGLFLILMLATLLIVHLSGDIAIGAFGGASFLLAALYALSIFVIQKYANVEVWRPVDLLDTAGRQRRDTYSRYEDLPLKELIAYMLLAAVCILVSGTLLALVADTLATQSGLGSSFIGVTLLAAATSLPELSTTIAAVRIRAYTMAISNILGSNMIMVFLILPADLMYQQGPILNHIDTSAAFALASGILVTAIYCIGLLIRRKKQVFGLGLDSVLVLLIYSGSLVMLYFLR
jgi:cation:H+ antiporter